MVLEWREREHGEVEEAVRADLMAQQALRACGLYNFWCLGGLRAKPKWALRPTWKLRFFPCIGLGIRGKWPQTRVHMRLF